jgi:DNA-binding winged helix-turn-helix (wHTH) protein
MILSEILMSNVEQVILTSKAILCLNIPYSCHDNSVFDNNNFHQFCWLGEQIYRDLTRATE